MQTPIQELTTNPSFWKYSATHRASEDKENKLTKLIRYCKIMDEHVVLCRKKAKKNHSSDSDKSFYLRGRADGCETAVKLIKRVANQ